MKSIFNPKDVFEVISRINKLNPDSQPQWGKMCVGQMLAHCNVTYEMVYENKHTTPGAIMKFMLKAFVKGAVVNEKPYSKTAEPLYNLSSQPPRFLSLKRNTCNYIRKTSDLGKSHFEGKESHSFGTLNASE